MQIGFVMMKYHQVISVAEIKTDPFNLFQPMIEIGKVKVGKVLAEVVADR